MCMVCVGSVVACGENVIFHLELWNDKMLFLCEEWKDKQTEEQEKS